MSRPMRIEYPGAVYHVQSQGNRNEPIFLDDDDREMFLKTFREVSRSCRWKVYAYALMDNHYHILFKTREANLVDGMKRLQTTYSLRFNRKHGLQGHLFAGRYKSMLVEADNAHYFSTIIDYIHLNPARAGLVRRHNFISASKWTSLQAWVGDKKERPDWVHPSEGLAAFACEDTPEGREKYLDHLVGRFEAECIDERSLIPVGHVGPSTVQRGWCYGSAAFRNKMIESLQNLSKRKPGNFGDLLPDMEQHRAELIVRKGLKDYHLTEELLFSTPYSYLQKLVIALAVRENAMVPYSWIAQRLNMGTPRSLGTLLHRAKKLAGEDADVRAWIDGVLG